MARPLQGISGCSWGVPPQTPRARSARVVGQGPRLRVLGWAPSGASQGVWGGAPHEWNGDLSLTFRHLLFLGRDEDEDDGRTSMSLPSHSPPPPFFTQLQQAISRDFSTPTSPPSIPRTAYGLLAPLRARKAPRLPCNLDFASAHSARSCLHSRRGLEAVILACPFYCSRPLQHCHQCSEG